MWEYLDAQGVVVKTGRDIDGDGTIYVSDSLANRVRRIRDGIITTVAGTGQAGFSGDDGPALQAQLNLPVGVGVDRYGSYFGGGVSLSFSDMLGEHSLSTMLQVDRISGFSDVGGCQVRCSEPETSP